LTNDIISRQDLMPWFACLYVEDNYRNQGLAERLLKHSLIESQKLGFDILYLSTELNDFYEKKGWKYHSKGFGVFGDEMKIYSTKTN
jgi:predicted acetyltransferase